MVSIPWLKLFFRDTVISSMNAESSFLNIGQTRKANSTCAHFPNSTYLLVVSLFFCHVTTHGLCQTAIEQSRADDGEYFEKHVRGILTRYCYECHSRIASEVQGGLLLDSRKGIREGGDTGPAVVPGNLGKSLLIAAIRHRGIQMPPDKKLPDDVIELLEKWIEMGAPDPREEPVGDPQNLGEKQVTSHHWSFGEIKAYIPPEVEQEDWVRSPIDCFVLAPLESQGLRPSPIAQKLDLCRRVHFDLTGLPPTPEQVDAFLSDESVDAYERMVDALLASPSYGERWGQHWLDVVRYAETEGFEYDRTVHGLWRYRDYVIQSFNEDLPFDVFVTQQIAGDELAPENQKYQIASGLHRLGAVRRNAGNQEVASSRNEVLTERTDIVGSAILGLTIGCARCHNHKFDPISQKDYYRLQAFFAASQEADIVTVPESERRRWEAVNQPVQSKIDELKKRLPNLDAEGQEQTRKQIASLEDQLLPPLPTVSTVKNDFAQETPIHVLKRGEYALRGDRVSAGTPVVFQNRFASETLSSEGGNRDKNQPRTILASWLTDKEHPLTARVIANRIWLGHFGRGIVATPNDFGANGMRPSHPELLDFLSRELMQNQWQLKRLHRLIMLSSTYRQSSKSDVHPRAQSLDPANTWLWQYPVRRLSAEEIRDSLLHISGLMNSEMGGPSVILPVDKELTNQLYKPSQWEVTRSLSTRNKRSIYLFAKRNLRLPFMEVFDQPTAQTSCSCRQQSTHAPQALEMLNGDVANTSADAFADRLERESYGNVQSKIDLGFRWTLGRLPTHEERSIAYEFLRYGRTREFALALFNLNAFLYVR